MSPGVLFALGSYALFSCGDAIIKGLGHGLSVYQIAFFTTLFSLGPALALTPKGESWLTFWKPRNILLLNLRGVSGVIGNLAIIYAFTTIPLAEAYSIAFLAPIFIVILSIQLLSERVSLARWIALAACFAGVLIVVRPGFRELNWGHLAAVASAICGATTNIILRRIGQEETRASLIGVASAYILVVNGVLMLVTGDIREISWQAWVGLLCIGGFGGLANILFIAATRRIQASVLGPIQYSQLFWALVFGATFYHEYPATVAYFGVALLIGGGIVNVMSGQTRIRIFSRLSPGGAGPSLIRETTRATGADAVLEAPIAGATEITSDG